MSWAHRRLHQPTWQRVRWAALRRAGFRCERCGKPARLEAHHRVPLERGGPAYDLENVEVLCFDHHRDAHQDDRAPRGGGPARLVGGIAKWVYSIGR